MDLDKEQLEALIKVTRTVNANIDYRAVLESLLTVTAEVMHVEACSLGLLSDDGQSLCFEVAVGGRPDEIRNLRMGIGEGIIGWVVQRRQPAIVNDVSHDSRFARRADDMTGFSTRSVLCVPVQSQDRLLGAMEVVNKKDGTLFTERDTAFLEAIAVQAAMAIQNANVHAERLEMAHLAALGEAVAGVAHGAKNMLSAITLGSRLVEVGLQEGDIESVGRAWASVKRGTQSMERMVLDMLAYCKDRTLHLGDTDLNALCLETCEIERAQAEARGVRIVTDCQLADPTVAVDSTAMQQVLINLIQNAADACEANKGIVTVSTRSDDVHGLVQLVVSDTGVGMTPEQAAAAFEPFHSTKGARGTGLGLSVVDKIISEHGGAIDLTTEPGQGATLTITLPRKA